MAEKHHNFGVRVRIRIGTWVVRHEFKRLRVRRKEREGLNKVKLSRIVKKRIYFPPKNPKNFREFFLILNQHDLKYKFFNVQRYLRSLSCSVPVPA